MGGPTNELISYLSPNIGVHHGTPRKNNKNYNDARISIKTFTTRIYRFSFCVLAAFLEMVEKIINDKGVCYALYRSYYFKKRIAPTLSDFYYRLYYDFSYSTDMGDCYFQPVIV